MADSHHTQTSSLAALFRIDLRSLALFRMGLALLILLDLGMRWPHIGLTLTDEGMMPRELRLAMVPHRDIPGAPPSIMTLTGTATGVKTLFVFDALFAVSLLVGYRTRLATLACYVFLLGLQSRNPVILDGGDVLLLVLVFWSLFVPLGAAFSVDAREGRGAPPGVTSITSVASAGLLLQVAYLYIFAGMEKWNPVWEYGGRALCHMFHLDLFMRPPGRMLTGLHPWLHVLPPFVTWGELLGGLLFLSPWRTDRVRLVMIGAFALLQLTFVICIQVTIFPLVSVLGTLLFLPASFWRSLGVGKGETEEEPTLREPRRAVSILALIAALMMTIVNLSHIAWVPLELPMPVKVAMMKIGFYQHWKMFSPAPPTVDGWPILEATLDDGRVLDLYTGEPVREEKPAVVIDLFRTFRESMLCYSLLNRDWSTPVAPHYLKYMVEEWDQAHPSGPRIREARLILVHEPTLLDCREGKRRRLVVAVHQGPPDFHSGSLQGNPR